MARRPAGRHARSVRRATPRRWLPFVALLGIVAGAVVVSARVDPPAEPVDAIATSGSKLPVAAEPGSISSTWYCAGGSASGSEGPAELSAVIANASDSGAHAEVTVVGSDGERRRAQVPVPANGRARIVARDVLTADWVAMTVEVFGGRATVEREVGGPDGLDVSPCSSTASARWYVPSGATVRGATERLVVFNPFPASTSIDLSFATDRGSLQPRSLQGVSIPGRSVRILTIDNPARRTEVAATVTARTGRIVVDRVQVYDGTGDAVRGTGDGALVTDPPRGLVSTPAIPATASRWFFPEARVLEGARTQVALHNPGDRTAELNVVITPEEPSLYPEVEPLQVNLRGGEETVLDLSELPGLPRDVGFSVDVRSLQEVPVAAELLLFTGPRIEQPVGEEPPADAEAEPGAPASDAGAGPVTLSFGPGVAVSQGSPVAATDWFLAGRGAGPRRGSLVVVANPGPRSVTVRVRELVGGARRSVTGATVTIPAGDRRTLDLTDTGLSSALLIDADGPVVVARLVAASTGRGVALGLATPLPDTVVPLPPDR